MRMVNEELSLYQGQESTFFHINASDQSSQVATGWLFFSIALGCLLTFTFFAVLSTSFYCCEKKRKKSVENTSKSFLNESNGEQKLLFPKVPATVYPTTHSIFQQEQNEVVESLSQAYRELPSTHLTYPSTYDSTVSVDQTLNETNDTSNQHLTTLPNSSQSSCKYRTTSLSSEQRDTTPNQSTIISISDYTCDPLRSHSAPGVDNESSVSIRVASSHNPKACMTSSTSGILSGDDLTMEQKTTFSENEGQHLLEPLAITCDQRERRGNNSSNGMRNELLKEKEKVTLDSEKHCHCCSTTKSVCLLPEKRSRSSGWGLSTKEEHPETRSHSAGALLTANRCHLAENRRTDKRAVTDCKDSCGIHKDGLTDDKDNFKRNTMIHDSSRGASSFGDGRFICSGNPNGTTLSNYYALTFCHDASFLSDKDESDSSLRGASVFGLIQASEASARRGVAEELNEGRGASAFCTKSKLNWEPLQGARRNEINQTTPEKHGVNTNFPAKTLTSACPDSKQYNKCKPIIDVKYEPREQNEPMRAALNDPQQIIGSERGASELGEGDNDTLCESVSLSFAYESASEDEMASHFTSPTY